MNTIRSERSEDRPPAVRGVLTESVNLRRVGGVPALASAGPWGTGQGHLGTIRTYVRFAYAYLITRGHSLATRGLMPVAYIQPVPRDPRFTRDGKDFLARSIQRGRVPLDPMPDWVLTRRRAIGERIRSRRRELHLSQAALGERVGRDHKTIHRWESAITNINLTDLLLLADALDLPLADLVR